MKSLIFTVPGKPMAKQRPRFNRKSGRTYTPEKTANYENLVALAFREKYPAHVPTSDPVTLAVCAVYPIPKSWTKKKQLEAIDGKIYPGKPDIDNIQKVIQDGLNNIAWADDSLIHTGSTSKKYGLNPGVTVLIEIEERTKE